MRHRRAGVAGVGLLDRVHRKRADGVDAKLIELGFRHHSPRANHLIAVSRSHGSGAEIGGRTCLRYRPRSWEAS